MQTFLPFADIKLSCKSLDKRRQFRQCVEARQILNVLDGKSEGWKNHPAVKMWHGYRDALAMYYNGFLDYCVKEHKYNIKKLHPIVIDVPVVYWPQWFGNLEFHVSHQNNLARKAFEDMYKREDMQLWNALLSVGINPATRNIQMEYVWPVNSHSLKKIVYGE